MLLDRKADFGKFAEMIGQLPIDWDLVMHCGEIVSAFFIAKYGAKYDLEWAFVLGVGRSGRSELPSRSRRALAGTFLPRFPGGQAEAEQVVPVTSS